MSIIEISGLKTPVMEELSYKFFDKLLVDLVTSSGVGQLAIS